MPNYSGLLNSKYGLVSAVGDGFQSAIQSFRQGRRDAMDEEELALNRRMRDKTYQLQLASAGLEDDGTGRFHESPLALAKKKREDEEKRSFEKYKTDLETKKEIAVKRAGLLASGGGNVPGFGLLPGATPTVDDAKHVKDSATVAKETIAAAEALKNMVQGGATSIPGKRKVDLNAAYTDLIMKLKEAEKLGALAGPDVEMLQKQVVDPTGFLNNMTLSEKDMAATYSDLVGRLKRDVGKRAEARGYSVQDKGLLAGGGFPRTVRNKNGQTATVSNEAELKEAMAEGFN